MLVVLSDTHSDNLDLPDRVDDALGAADAVVHAGDFTSRATYESLAAETDRLEAVHGNRDSPWLKEHLPATDVFEYATRRIAVVHGDRHDETALGLAGRSEDADLVVFGHSHRPEIVETEEVVLLNPGSPTRPRGYDAAYAVLEPAGTELRARVLGVTGEELAAAVA